MRHAPQNASITYHPLSRIVTVTLDGAVTYDGTDLAKANAVLDGHLEQIDQMLTARPQDRQERQRLADIECGRLARSREVRGPTNSPLA